jgi:Ca2+/H+ antiporter
MQSPKKQAFPPALAAITLAAVVVILIPPWIPALRTGPWEWIIIFLQAVVTVAMVVYLVRFVRKQRDDYWRERGKDPKHPEL